MALRLLQARIGAIRLCLNENQGTAAWAPQSRLQAKALVDVINRSKGELEAETLGMLATLVSEVKWCDGDDVMVLNALSVGTQAVANRRGGQDWGTMLEFYNVSFGSVMHFVLLVAVSLAGIWLGLVGQKCMEGAVEVGRSSGGIVRGLEEQRRFCTWKIPQLKGSALGRFRN